MDERRSRGREGVAEMPVFSYVQYITEFEFNVSSDKIQLGQVKKKTKMQDLKKKTERKEQYNIRNFCCFPHHPSHMLSAVCVARYKKKIIEERERMIRNHEQQQTVKVQSQSYFYWSECAN